MVNTESQSVNRGRYPWEFWLVSIMLTSLLILVLWILRSSSVGTINPPSCSEKNCGDQQQATAYFDKVTAYNNMMLAHRKDVLAIIITAFGAWVGAGAAYFFGRENLRVSADSLLAMRDVSPNERLRRTSIKQIPPTPLEWTVKKTDTVESIKTKLTERPELWFIPIVNEVTGKLENVINEEAIWRYLISNPLTSPSTVHPTVQDILSLIDSTPGLKRFSQIHVAVTMDTTVGAANELMDSKKVFLAIVETDGKPTHFFTTSEVRKLLLKS